MVCIVHIETRSHVEKKLLEYILLLRIISIPNPNALKTFIQQEYNLPIKFYNAILLLKRAVSQHRDDVTTYLCVVLHDHVAWIKVKNVNVLVVKRVQHAEYRNTLNYGFFSIRFFHLLLKS